LFGGKIPALRADEMMGERMFRRLKKSWLHYTLTASLGFSPLSVEVAWAQGGGCTQRAVNACKSIGSSAVSGLSGQQVGGSLFGNAANSFNNMSAAQQGLSQGAGDCAAAGARECQKCTSPAEKKQCMQQVQDQANNMQQQSDQMGGGAGDMSQILPLLAGLGAMAAMMAMQKKNQPPPQPPPPPQQVYGALQPNCSLNCAMADSYQYADCDNYLESACAGYGVPMTSSTGQILPTPPPVTGTIIAVPGGMMAKPDCGSFVNRYCQQAQAPLQQNACQLPNGMVLQLNMAGTGEGYGRPFCKQQIAQQWCNDPTYGAQRQLSCQTCRGLASETGQTCAVHPELCLADSTGGSSPNNTVCAGEPGFSGGGTTFGGGPGVAVPAAPGAGATQTVGSAGTTGTSGPTTAVSLPQSAGAGSGRAAKGGGFRVASAGSGGQSAEGAVREGQGNGAIGGAGGKGGGPGSLRVASVGKDNLAAVGGVIMPGTVKGVARGPASDVYGAYGPSVFALSTLVYRQYCEAGKFNNCP
jgi:hypothetical protein